MKTLLEVLVKNNIKVNDSGVHGLNKHAEYMLFINNQEMSKKDYVDEIMNMSDDVYNSFIKYFDDKFKDISWIEPYANYKRNMHTVKSLVNVISGMDYDFLCDILEINT